MGRLPIFFVEKMDSCTIIEPTFFYTTSEKAPGFERKAHKVQEFDSVKKGDWFIRTLPTYNSYYCIYAYRIIDKTAKHVTISIEDYAERIKLSFRDVPASEYVAKYTVLYNTRRGIKFYWFMTDAEFQEAIAPLL